MPYRFFDDPYVYGPVTEEEFENLTVHHRTTFANGQRYIGVSREIKEFEDRLIQRPPQPEPEPEPTEE
jgi:hypothetical protein